MTFDVTFIRYLQQIDLELAEAAQEKKCPHCGQPLHRAPYDRKPGGLPPGFPSCDLRRLSLCCSRCRKRLLPPSCLFLGRWVYLGAIVLLHAALVQGSRRAACPCPLLERPLTFSTGLSFRAQSP